MLKIAKSVEYALLALKYIYERQDLDCVSTKVISESVDIPYDLLAKIMQKLVKDEIIISQQGTKGGYTLALPPDKINITRIVNAVEQKVQVTDCMVETPTLDNCKRYQNCCLRNPLNQIQLKINKLFDELTLGEIIQYN